MSCCHCEEQSSETWQSQTLVVASEVFAIASSEDLLAMTNVLKRNSNLPLSARFLKRV
ncbi:MAG: hypothetical protein V4642_14545 [Bacteroidota bacterium]